MQLLYVLKTIICKKIIILSLKKKEINSKAWMVKHGPDKVRHGTISL